MIAFLYYFAALGAILSGSLLFPALVAFGYGETDTGYLFLVYAALGGFLFGATLLAVMGRVGGLDRNVAILLAVTSWIVFPGIVAIPMADVAGLSYMDGLFEAASSLTTTGASNFANLETLPKSVILFRAQLQWLGGIATLITLVLVLAPWQIGGLPKAGTASIAASLVASQTRLLSFCGSLFQVFLVLTVLCFVFLLMSGVETFNALIVALSALSTGGFMPSDQSGDVMLGTAGLLVTSMFLLIGATSIFWHRQLFLLRFEELRSHRESYFVLAGWFLLSLYIAWELFRVAGSSEVLSPVKAMAEGMFNAASIISTSAIQSRPGVFTILPPTLVLMLLLIGAGCYSTSGGIKYFRLGGMLSLAHHELNRLIYPHSVRPSRFGNTTYDAQFMKAIWSLFTTVIVLIAISVCILSISGMGFQASFTATIAAIANAGPAYGPEWAAAGDPQWPSYGDMSIAQKLTLSTVMILGRLEIIAAIACLNLALWLRR